MTTENAVEAAHGAPANATEYIKHHLSHLHNASGTSNLDTINLDTFWISAALGLVFLGRVLPRQPPRHRPACRASCRTSSKP